MQRRKFEDAYPLTSMQKGMLFHSVESAGSGVYVSHLHCVLPGDLDADAFERAWHRVVQRHPVLRTSFLWKEMDEPVQVVHWEAPPVLRKFDWSCCTDREYRERLGRFLEEDRVEGFAMEGAPLIRLALLLRPDGDHDFSWAIHHALMDGWCFPLIVGEVFELYGALREGREPSLPTPRRYRDYVAWLHRQDAAAAERFWREELRGFDTPTPLPSAERGSGSAEDAGYGEHWHQLSAAETGELQQAARRGRVTLNTLVQGAWTLLLARYGGTDDVVYGATTSGRPAELEGAAGMVGLFINTLPARVRIPGEARVGEWLVALQDHQAEVRRYEYTPLMQLQAWSEVPGGTPLFDTLLVFENFRLGEVLAGREAALPVREVSAVGRTSFPLALVVFPSGPLAFQFTYRRGRFGAAAVERMGEHLAALVRGLARDPGRRVDAVPLLAPAERAQVLEAWNRTEAAYSQVCAHEQFAAQARRTPEFVALAFRDQRLTYAELEARANRLANHLRRRGVGPDVRVGLCVERSAEMWVGVLGVLAAGGAYVPLDPGYPAERLALMAGDAGLAVVLTQRGLLEVIPSGTAEVVCLDRDWPAIAAESDRAPETGVDPDNLAYVIYTSGSTGRPKGVALAHRPLANLVAWQERDWRRTRAAVTLQFASISFDASFHEAFCCWADGGTLVVAPEETRHDPAALLALVERERVERLFMPAVALQHLAEEADARGIVPSRLKEVQTAGEALRVTEPMRRWFAALGAPLHNHYGPSETHVATAFALEGDPAGWPLLPSIGGPISNSTGYVLDRHLEPVPVRVPGELYLSGTCLARGYLGRPDLSADRFVPDPYGGGSGARMYRTGDRVRWLGDGTLEFLGRADQQVKLRGFRVEPGEVEAALEEHPGVREALVDVRGEGADKRLVAYVVPAAGAAPGEGEFREHVRGRLPEYMVPGVFVVLEGLPLTPSGKVNRRALPEPELSSGTSYVAPRTPREEILAGIWAEVLKVERVGMHDNFFALGGHSLLAMRVVSRMREALGVGMTVRAIFEAPTLDAFARLLPEPASPGAAEPMDGPPIGTVSSPQHLLSVIDELSEEELDRLLAAES